MKKEETPSLLSIDSQSVKAAPFSEQDKGIDGNKRVNGRKRHIITDSLGLLWRVLVHAAHQADGVMAEKVIEPLQGYLDRMKKILADAAYEKVFSDWGFPKLAGRRVGNLFPTSDNERVGTGQMAMGHRENLWR